MILAMLENGLPASEILDYFVNCLVSLVELLCSGFSNCEGYVNFFLGQENTFVAFYKSLELFSEPESYMQ
jgi:hypothetical protein